MPSMQWANGFWIGFATAVVVNAGHPIPRYVEWAAALIMVAWGAWWTARALSWLVRHAPRYRIRIVKVAE